MRTFSQFLLTFLLNASWQILLIAAMASLCDRILTGTAARYRHTVWVVALFLMLLLPVLSSTPNFTAPPRVSISTPPTTEHVPVVVTRISSLAGDEIQAAEEKTPAATVAPTAPTTTERNWSSPIPVKFRLAAAVVAIYALLVLYALLRLARAWRQTRKIVRGAFEIELPESAKSIIETCGRAIATRRVRVLCSSSIPVPITLGVFRPVIILPQSLLLEIDENLLISAVGHELVHIQRRDYLTNLVYEFVYLPVWFHPAAWLIRRRIRQTRELCCDERVTSKLVRPDVYARSLVRMIGTAPLTPRMAADTTIGIVESDNLEGRIMSLLKSRKLTGRRKNILLLIASLLLAVPCIAATPFALSFEINQQEAVGYAQSRDQKEEEKQARLRAEMFEQVQKLKEEERVANPSARREIEQRLREVQKNLEEHQRLMQQNQQLDPKAMDEAKARLRQVQQNLDEHQRLLQKYQQQEGANADRYREAHKRFAELLTKYEESSEMQYAKKYLEAQKSLEQQYYAANPQTRRPRVIRRVEPVYPADAREKNIKGSVVLTMVVDREGNPTDIKVWRSLHPSMDQAAIEAAGQMRFEPALKDGQPVSETLLVEFYFSLESKHTFVMGYGEGKGDGKGQGSGTYIFSQGSGEGAGNSSGQGSGAGAGNDSALRELRLRRERETGTQEDRARRQAELAQGAVITMDRAIQVATSKYPGKVLACSLGRDKDGPVFYHVVIIVSEGDKTATKYVWISALDGTILKTEDEKKPIIRTGTMIEGGVLNGKATSLPLPVYPDIARAARAGGAVTVQIAVDEQGNVVSARPISGHPLLQGAATTAARQAKFSPTFLQGQPVSVSGQLVYSFSVQ
ncbi:MAG TPA: TonB family protein [Pyrinomonadaceae bacterium]|nr:TonB family protein [Pyrinomonadaceae bacterium]